MINAEKFKSELLAVANKKRTFALKADDPTVIRNCHGLACSECLFHTGACYSERIKWLLSEYKEPIKLTRFERDVLKHCLYKNRNYIARDYNDNLFVYQYAPKKDGNSWENLINCDSLNLCEDMFLCVTWSDEEPRSIVELLKDCEAVENEKENKEDE